MVNHLQVGRFKRRRTGSVWFLRCWGRGGVLGSLITRGLYLRSAIALFVVYYNFAKWHESIRMTPAMYAGLTKKPWTVADILDVALKAA